MNLPITKNDKHSITAIVDAVDFCKGKEHNESKPYEQAFVQICGDPIKPQSITSVEYDYLRI